jgi:serine/threonine-protein kinase
MLTGERPFNTKGLSPVEIERLVFDTDPAMPSTQAATQPWRGALKGDIDTIILKSLQNDPDERYGSAAELAEDIESFLNGMPISARSAGLSYRLGKFVKRHRVSLVVGSIVAVFLVIGLVNSLVQGERERTQLARFDSAVTLLFTLFEQVDPDLNPGKKISPVSLLDVGAAQLSQLDAGPEAHVDLLRVLGVLYSKLGERERGETLLREAVDAARDTLEPTDNTIGQTLNSLGRYLAQRGKLQEAEERLRDSIQALSIAGDSGLWLLSAERDLADTLALQGRRDDAISLYERNIVSHAPLLNDDPRNLAHRNLVMARYALADVYNSLGRLDEATEVVVGATAMARGKLGAEHPELAMSLEVLGSLLEKKGDTNAAGDALREALSIYRKTYTNGHQSIGRVLASLAKLEAGAGNSNEATALYDEALAVWEPLGVGTHAEMADRLRVRAIRELDRGNVDAAIELQQSAVAARRQAHASNNHWRVADEQTFLESIRDTAPGLIN